MNVERDIAGVALPFAAGVLVAAYTGATFCSNFTSIHFCSLLIIFFAVTALWKRKISCLSLILIGINAFFCGVISSLTAISLYDMPISGIETFCREICINIQNHIDAIPFKSADTSALMKALLTGEKGTLSNEIKSAFRESGASHILALSGLHLGIIYGILSKSLSILGNTLISRRIRSILIICICGLYTLATGSGDSLIRALIFITLREIAIMTSRYHGLGQVLLASLIIQLVFDPLAIRSVSFQLSYAAMAGIAFIYPWLQSFWDHAADILDSQTSTNTPTNSSASKSLSGVVRVTNGAGIMVNKASRWIWNTVALSIACQITTAPLAWHYFGTFPQYFMLTNLLTLPLTGLLIPVALLTLILSILDCCPISLINITEWLTGTLTGILEVISTI